MNEKGLSIGALWLDETRYAEPAAADNALSVQDVGAWVLGNFATVPEVKAGLQTVTVWGESSKEIGMVPPFHLAIHDALGNHLVVEFIEGETKTYDNPAGVLTNSPTFDWHLTDAAYHKANQEDMGMLPVGTASGPRFVLLTELTQSLPKPKSVREAVQFAFYVMGRASSVPGEGNSYVPDGSSYTEWTVVRDHKNLVFYYETLLNTSCRALDLKTLTFAEGQPVKSLSMEGDGAGWYTDMSSVVK